MYNEIAVTLILSVDTSNIRLLPRNPLIIFRPYVHHTAGLGRPRAMHCRVMLAPRGMLMLVNGVVTTGLKHLSSSVSWKNFPALASGPEQVK